MIGHLQCHNSRQNSSIISSEDAVLSSSFVRNIYFETGELTHILNVTLLCFIFKLNFLRPEMSILNKLGVFLNQQFKLFQMPPFPSL